MISRDELYQLVWSEPMIKAAERFQVSSNYLARICSLLKVPRPGRGYWAKLTVGNAPRQTPLPPAEPGDPEHWAGKGGSVVAGKPQAQPLTPAKKSARVPNQTHELIRDARAHFENSRPIKEHEYLRPYKRKLVDVTASKGGLVKALELANNLFKELSAVGYRVNFAAHSSGALHREDVDEREIMPKRSHSYWRRGHWTPYSPTVVYVGTVAIGLSIVEMSESVAMRYANGKYIRESEYVAPKGKFRVDHSWSTTQDLPSGRMKIVAYSPYYPAPWSMTWQEEKSKPLTNQLQTVVQAIAVAAPGIVGKLEEAEREAEAQRRRWQAEEHRKEREEDRKRSKQSFVDSREELKEAISRWSELVNTERFLTRVARHAAGLPEHDKSRALERLALARSFLGDLDPLSVILGWKTPQERYTARFPSDKSQADDGE